MERWENEQNISEMMIYTTEDGLTKIETTFDGDTVWLSIDQMAELFQRDKSTISRHIKNIFAEGELKRAAVVANFATTAADGKTYQVDYYNLDVIISVGYRVKSQRGVQFRIWATKILKEYMRKGFALDDERLKNLGGGGYFKELSAINRPSTRQPASTENIKPAPSAKWSRTIWIPSSCWSRRRIKSRADRGYLFAKVRNY